MSMRPFSSGAPISRKKKNQGVLRKDQQNLLIGGKRDRE